MFAQLSLLFEDLRASRVRARMHLLHWLDLVHASLVIGQRSPRLQHVVAAVDVTQERAFLLGRLQRGSGAVGRHKQLHVVCASVGDGQRHLSGRVRHDVHVLLLEHGHRDLRHTVSVCNVSNILDRRVDEGHRSTARHLGGRVLDRGQQHCADRVRRNSLALLLFLRCLHLRSACCREGLAQLRLCSRVEEYCADRFGCSGG